MHIIIGILAAIVIFAILVAVHEGGHFLTAKATGVKVNEFSIGMGPLLFKKVKGDTTYSLRLLPVGGYVSMEGESEDSEDERAFNKKPAWVKALILAAGPFMNFVLAVVVLGGIITYMGTSVSPVINTVQENLPAYEAGLREGDIVVAINGTEVSTGQEISDVTSTLDENAESVEITYTKAENPDVRRTADIEFTVKEDGSKVIGLTFDVNHNVITGMWLGIKNSVVMEKEMLSVLGELITGRGSAEDLVGPVGIVNVVDRTAQVGFLNLIYLLALLSLNLGLVNILPFPALDGGRLLFLFIRLFTGKAITDELENKIHFIGIMILFMFMIMITMKDINTFILK